MLISNQVYQKGDCKQMNLLSYRDKLYYMSTSNGSMQDLITRINLNGLSGTTNQNIAIVVKPIELPPYVPYGYKGSTTSL